MGDSIGKWARFSTLLLGVLCASFGTGCGSDPERDASPEASSSEPLTLLDCTDEDGRPEKLANVETEFYHTDVMAALLEEDAELRGSFGKASVEDCTEARRFMERYEEDKERIDAELLAKHPEAPVEDVQPASEDEPPTTEPPAEEVAKINSGYATSFPFVVKLKTNAGLCSGVLISPRALLTSAHCVPVNGTYLTTIEQQQVTGASPVVMMNAATWLTLKRHPYYLGAGHVAADLAVGTLYYANNSFGPSSFARIWMDSIPIGGTDFMLGFGSTYPGENTWNGTLHAGTGRIDGVYDYEMWVFGDTSPPRTTCPGDSGGAHGAWHGNFMLYAVNSSGGCGEVQSYFSIGTRMRYNTWFVEQEIGTCTTYTTQGQYYKRCW